MSNRKTTRPGVLWPYPLRFWLDHPDLDPHPRDSGVSPGAPPLNRRIGLQCGLGVQRGKFAVCRMRMISQPSPKIGSKETKCLDLVLKPNTKERRHDTRQPRRVAFVHSTPPLHQPRQQISCPKSARAPDSRASCIRVPGLTIGGQPGLASNDAHRYTSLLGDRRGYCVVCLMRSCIGVI